MKDHYEVFYTVDVDPTEFQTQIYSSEGSLTEIELQTKLIDAYVAKTTGVNFNYVTPIPAAAPTPTPAEIAISAKEEEVNSALNLRILADYKTKKAEEISLRISRTEAYIDSGVDPTILAAIKADLKIYATTAIQEYKAANDVYDIKKAELDALLA